MRKADRSSCSVISCSFSSEKRLSGKLMLSEAMHSPCCEKIGAAIAPIPAVNSPRVMAKPCERMVAIDFSIEGFFSIKCA